MSEKEKNGEQEVVAEESQPQSGNRRDFLKKVGVAAAIGAAAAFANPGAQRLADTMSRLVPDFGGTAGILACGLENACGLSNQYCQTGAGYECSGSTVMCGMPGSTAAFYCDDHECSGDTVFNCFKVFECSKVCGGFTCTSSTFTCPNTFTCTANDGYYEV